MKNNKSGNSRKTTVFLAASVLILTGLFLRANYLRQSHPYIDEYFTMLAADMVQQHGYPLLPSGLIYTPGLLYTYLAAILGGLLKIVGPVPFQAEMVYRIPNLLISAGAMASIFFVAKQWFSNYAALIALTLMALYPHGIVWGARVRMYTLVFLLLPLVAYAFYRASLFPEKWCWLLLALGLFFMGTLAHNWMMIMAPPLVVGAAIVARGSGSLARWRWQGWLPALVVIGIASFISIRLASLFLPTHNLDSQDMGWHGILLATLGRLNPVIGLMDSVVLLNEFVWQNWFNLPLVALSLLALPALWLLRPTRSTTHQEKQMFLAMVYLYILFLGAIFEFVFVVEPGLRHQRYASPVMLLAFIIIGGWVEFGLTTFNRNHIQAVLSKAAILILLVVLGWLSFLQVPRLFYSSLPPVAYEKAFQFVRQNFVTRDALLSPLPAAAHFYFDDPGYFIGQHATDAFINLNNQGIIGDRWRGAPWLRETEVFKDVLRTAPRTWLVIDTFTFGWQFDSDWIQIMRRNTPKVWEEDGVMVFRGEGLVYDLPTTPDVPVNANFANLVTLTGYNRTFTSDSLHLILFWSVQNRLPADYTIFVHIRNDAGDTVAQADVQPLSGEYPTSRWRPGETVVDEMSVHLPENLPAGKYHLLVGLYRWDTLERLPVLNDVTGENAVLIESMELK